jgi:transposase
MLQVAEVNYIKFRADKEDSSYAEIARQVQRDPRTVKKYAEKEDWNSNKEQKQKRKARVMDPVKPIIDQWLREDLKKKKKYRRTAKRIYELLKEKHNFTGSDRSVRRYVSQRKKELLEEYKCSLPLEAKPGTAQVDFGETPFIYQGRIVNLHYLVLSFPNSNTFYFQVFEGENQECFLEGLKRIFNHLGGVPRAIRFDNLSAGVKKILPDGKRELTEQFQKFIWHYNFQPEFCNPGKGNEKGHIESMVKYVRNNFLLPEPNINDLEAYNETLWKLAEDDRYRKHYKKDIMLSEIFEEDKKALLVLPTKEYNACSYEKVKANNYGKVNVDKKIYSTSPRFAQRNVWVKKTYNKVEILDEDYNRVVTHPRLYGHKKESMIWPPYLKLMAKRPMAIKYTSFYRQLPVDWQDYLTKCTREEKQAALRLLAELLKERDLNCATKALMAASKYGHPSTDSIKQVFVQIVKGRGLQKPLNYAPPSLPAMPVINRGLKQYDDWMQKRGVQNGAAD